MPSLATLKFTCPSTKGELVYRLEVDAKILIGRWSKKLRCRCPYCKSLHKFSFREGYVDGMISQFGQPLPEELAVVSPVHCDRSKGSRRPDRL